MNLNSALDKIPNYKGTVTRSLEFYDDETLQTFLKSYSVGGSIGYKEFLSTTRGETYNPDGQVQITIVDAENGKDISLFNFKEKEVLYNTNTSFKVEELITQDGKTFVKLAERK